MEQADKELKTSIEYPLEYECTERVTIFLLNMGMSLITLK